MQTHKTVRHLTALVLSLCFLLLMPTPGIHAEETDEAYFVERESAFTFELSPNFVSSLLALVRQMIADTQKSGGRNGLRIAVIAGHGGNTGAHVGADLSTAIWEDAKNLEIALAANEELRARGYDTKMNRTNNAISTKEEKLKMFKEYKPDVLLEFHHNISGTGKAEGLEVWYDSGNAKGQKLAELLAPRLAASVGLKNRGAKGDDYAPQGSFYIVGSFPVALLIECAFLDNPNDLTKLNTAAKRTKFAKAAADVVDEYLGIVS
ncbi:MAG: N-acetylmuramoyl-L-alanine amidase [Oscillospiraceae bacterium]|jgi:N-acetylmuramoyl-L-alanine amidase|nr:N-acetylmuramoyl-L-alanine amidase [Oscillospiraceae bacterium]